MSTGSVGRSIRNALRQSATWSAPIASTSRLTLPSSPAQLSGCTCFHTSSRQSSSHPPTKQAGAAPSRKKRTILDIQGLKRKKIPITVLTAHDFPSARFIESSSAPSADPSSSHRRGIDICLVGDSLAMVACGYTSTTSLTTDELLYHCRSVARGCHSSFLVADLPFGTYAASIEDGVKTAVRIIQEGHMDAVKIEGGKEICGLIERLTSRGIPVMGHVGLTPQRQSALSGFRVQGKTVSSALKVWEDAQAVQAAGAFSLVIEAVPSRLAKFISDRLDIPTIGIGAGAGADGQVLVQLDMLGVNSLERGPKFLKRFEDLESKATGAIQEYVREVREGVYPVEELHGYPMEETEWEGFLDAVKEK